MAILRGVVELWLSQCQGAPQLFEDGPFVGHVAVQLQASITDVNVVQAPFHNFESRHLLGHEQDPLVVGDGFGDQVRDGLRLTGSRRALDDQVATVLDVYHSKGLGAVGVDDLMRVGHLETVV